MKLFVSLVVSVGCLVIASSVHAQTGNTTLGRHGVPGARQADRHNPFSSSYVNLTPGGHFKQTSYGYQPGYGPSGYAQSGYGYGQNGYGYGQSGYGGNAYGSPYGGYPYSGYSTTSLYQSGWGLGYGSGYVGGGYLGYSGLGYSGLYGGYPNYYQNNFVYPYGANGNWGPYSNYGPLVLPSNQIYGVGALPQGAFLPAQLTPRTTTRAVEVEKPKPREANDEALRRALKFIDYGDQLFAQQKFLEAYQRYQSANSAAPDLADAHFRRGFALIAMNRYERAAEAFKRGVLLNPQWPKSQFRLEDIYTDNELAKQAHIDSLATTLEKEPNNADAAFLLGLMLYFDNQQERSRPFLQQAFQLMRDDLKAEGLLDPAAPAAGGAPNAPAAAAPQPPANPKAPPAKPAPPDGLDI